MRGKVHTEQERSTKSDVTQQVTPIAITSGTRTSLHMRPFVLISALLVAIQLYPDRRPGEPVGEVLATKEAPKQREVEVGNVQAWAYPDNTLVPWECFLNNFVRDHSLQADPNMASLVTTERCVE